MKKSHRYFLLGIIEEMKKDAGTLTPEEKDIIEALEKVINSKREKTALEKTLSSAENSETKSKKNINETKLAKEEMQEEVKKEPEKVEIKPIVKAKDDVCIISENPKTTKKSMNKKDMIFSFTDISLTDYSTNQEIILNSVIAPLKNIEDGDNSKVPVVIGFTEDSNIVEKSAYSTEQEPTAKTREIGVSGVFKNGKFIPEITSLTNKTLSCVNAYSEKGSLFEGGHPKCKLSTDGEKNVIIHAIPLDINNLNSGVAEAVYYIEDEKTGKKISISSGKTEIYETREYKLKFFSEWKDGYFSLYVESRLI